MSRKYGMVDNWCHTCAGLTEVSFLWTIDRFSQLTESTGYAVNSSEFSDRDNSETKWHLELYPKGYDGNYDDHISLYLMMSSGQKNTRVKFTAVIIDGKGNDVQKNELNRVFSSGNRWGFPQFISRSRLMDSTNHMLTNDCLTIYCEVSYSGTSKTFSGRRDFLDKYSRDHYIKNMNQLYSNPIDSDVVLEVDGNQFKAHKLILKTRSKVFAAMFSGETEENLKNKVVIKDIDNNTFEEMLRFLYTGDKSNLKLSLSLLVAADKYDLVDLKVICEDYMASNLTAETVSDVLALADMHSAQELKSKAIDFIKDNTKDVMKTNNWKNIKNPELIAEIMSAIVDISQ